eukprot:scaffold117914_cov14-Prasinocladus_malaysianus.AAC.1
MALHNLIPTTRQSSKDWRIVYSILSVLLQKVSAAQQARTHCLLVSNDTAGQGIYSKDNNSFKCNRIYMGKVGSNSMM